MKKIQKTDIPIILLSVFISAGISRTGTGSLSPPPTAQDNLSS